MVPDRKWTWAGAAAICGLTLAGCHAPNASNTALQLDPVTGLAVPVAAAPAGNRAASPALLDVRRPLDAPIARESSDLREDPVSAQEKAGSAKSAVPGGAESAKLPAAALKSLTLPDIDPNKPVVLKPGVTVCEPIPDAASGVMTDFGAGCTRWLTFALGGVPELGRTPVWESPDRVKYELHRKDYRLSPQDAPRLAGMLGVTHVVTGQVVGIPAHCTLTYQLQSVPDGKPLGTPVAVSGSQAEVVAALPGLAKQIVERIGVSSQGLPETVDGNQADIATLGSLPWTTDFGLTSPQRQAALALAKRLPPAGLLMLTSRRMAEPQIGSDIVRTLLRQASENPLVMAELALQVGYAPHEIAQAIARNATLHPDNYLCSSARLRMMRTIGNVAAERQAIERAIKCSPGNPNGWLALAKINSAAADRIRYGRSANALNRSEWNTLNTLYAGWLVAARKATQADPDSGQAWHELASAATFASESVEAEDAFWKAVALNKADPEVYAWGLQMYQAKWGGSASSLAKVADAAADAPLENGPARRRVLEALEEAECATQAAALRSKMEAAALAAIAAAPRDAQAHYELAAIYEKQNPGRAMREYKAVVELRPNDARAYYDLAEIYWHRGRNRDAENTFREAIKRQPDWGRAHCELGWVFKNDQQIVEAEKEMRTSLNYPMSTLGIYRAHLGLGEIYVFSKRASEAVPELKAAIKTDPMIPDAYPLLCYGLTQIKQFKEAVRVGLYAERMQPQGLAPYISVSYDYSMLNQPELAIEQCRKALQIQPNEPVAHENLGDALYKVGQKEAARTEWETTLKLAPNSPAGKEAQQNLATKK